MSRTAASWLPEADSPREVLGTMHMLLTELGRELGDRYDERLRVSIGPNWLQALGNIRRKHLTLRDPHFVLTEPLRNPDSPTRSCLPGGGAFYNKVEDALDVRNAWAHHEIDTYDLATLEKGVRVIHALATAAELRLGAQCAAIARRIADIRSGKHGADQPQPSAVVPGEVEMEALRRELAVAHARQEQLKADAEAAQALLDEAFQVQGALEAARIEEQQRLLDELAQAQVAQENLENVLEALQAQRDREPSDVESGNLVPAKPGHRWPADPPTRRTLMMAMRDDLFDEALGRPIAAEFGERAPAVIASWKANLPVLTPIFLTSAGQAVANIDGVPIYLGSLGSSSARGETTADQVLGFFAPHTYTLRIKGQIEDRATGDTLQEVNPQAAREVSKRLLALMPNGGRLRLTTSGALAHYSQGAWRSLFHVSDADWFPGHVGK